MKIAGWLGLVLASVLLLGAGPTGAGPGAPPDDSVYQLAGALTDQAGRTVHLDVAQGHPVLVSMFYASCTDSCPLLIAELRRVEAALAPAARDDVRVVLVSVDPERDTPAALQRLAEQHRLDAARWRLLTGSDNTVREIAALLGVKFRRLSNGMINHSSVITVLDRRGVVQTRVEGITPGDRKLVARLTAALARAAAGPPAPPANGPARPGRG